MNKSKSSQQPKKNNNQPKKSNKSSVPKAKRVAQRASPYKDAVDAVALFLCAPGEQGVESFRWASEFSG